MITPVSSVPGQQDGALFALGKHCPGLLSLNVALVGSVTDAGVSALSRGCSSLQALNIAGAKEASAFSSFPAAVVNY